MRECEDKNILLLKGVVYKRVGSLDEAGIDPHGRPSGYKALERITLGELVFEPGDELPDGPLFLGAGHFPREVPVKFGIRPDLDRLVELGVAKPPRKRRKKAKGNGGG